MTAQPGSRNEKTASEITRDDIGNGLFILQKKDGFRFGIDAVLLSHFASVPDGGKAMDLCTGSGIIPHLMWADARKAGRSASFLGLEISESAASLAKESALLNGLSGEVEIVQGDVKEAAELFPAGSFDTVTCNPPYTKAGCGRVELTADGKFPEKMAARHELLMTFGDAASAARHLLKSGGWFYLVHRPARLPEIMGSLKENAFSLKMIRFVHPAPGREATMALLAAQKNAGEQLTVLPPLFVEDGSGTWTDELLSIYGMERKD